MVMSGPEKASRNLSEDQIEVLVRNGAERFVARKKSMRNPTWLEHSDQRKKALSILETGSDVSLMDFARSMGMATGSMSNSINTWIGRRYGQGGREVLIGILKELEKDKYAAS